MLRDALLSRRILPDTSHGLTTHSALFAFSTLPDLPRRLHRRHVFIRGIQTIPALGQISDALLAMRNPDSAVRYKRVEVETWLNSPLMIFRMRRSIPR